MSVWQNEQDFMRNMDMLSEFYIKDKKVTPKKLNIQRQQQNKSWYDSDSDDDFVGKGQNGDGSSKCPSMKPMDTLQMMHSIRMQVRNVVGDRYNNDVLETYYKMDRESNADNCDSSKMSEPAVPFVQPQVNESSSNTDTKVKVKSSVNNHKTDVEEPIASSSKFNNSKNVSNRVHGRGIAISNRASSRGSSRYHNNVAFASLNSKKSYNYKSESEFPAL